MMRSEPSLIMLEFNELCPSLMERFIRAGHLPYFKQFHQESEIYTTDVAAEGDNLNPWVQWIAVHSGLATDVHNIKTWSEGHLLPAKAGWDLSDAGYRVLVCGSMNSRYDVPLRGCLPPDSLRGGHW